MDEMEYVSHSSEATASAASQAQQAGPGAGAGAGAGAGTVAGAGSGTPQTQTQSAPGPHSQTQQQYQAQNHTQQPQPSGCPYFRGGEHHQPHFHQHHSHLPLPPQHPLFSQQQQHAILNPHQSHSQLHSQSQPQIQHQGFLSQPQNRNASSHHAVAQLHYDPVHAATNNWYPAPAWSGPNLPPHPPLHHHHSRTSSSDTYFNGLSVHSQGPGSGGLSIGSVGVPGGSPAIHGLGLIHGQTPQHQLPPHHEPFTPLPYYYRPQPPNVHRFPGITPPVSSHNQNQANNSSNTNTNQSSMNNTQSQSGLQQQQSTSQTNPRGISLPTPNPPPPPPHFTANMSGSGESTPDLPTNRRSMFGNLGDSPRGSTGNESAASSTDAQQSRSATNSLFGDPESSRPEATSSARSNQPGLSTPPPPPNTERRRPYSRAPVHIPDYDSDDELDQLEDDHQALRFIEQFSMGGNFPRDMGEAQVRAHQILRGQMPNKRVASKKALSQLQSVDMDSLEESERTCVICYNEFGVENPEGINEAPLRLPGCKHIFGDHCIKKWFEESDSCPYCRDKVPSEPIIPFSSAQLSAQLSSAQIVRDIYRQRMHNARGMPFSDLNLRIVPHRGDDSRFDSSPPRAWQTGDRRSPPSEASESRRRTRPRHSSFRGTPSTAGSSRHSSSHAGGSSSMAPLQQSPARERFTSQRPYFYHPGSHLARFSMPPMPSYQSSEPVGLTSPPQVGGFGSMANAEGSSSVPHPYQPPVHGGSSGTALSPGGDPLPGPAQIDAYSQQLPPSASLPPVVAAEDLSFGSSTNTGPSPAMLRFGRADGVVYLMQ